MTHLAAYSHARTDWRVWGRGKDAGDKPPPGSRPSDLAAMDRIDWPRAAIDARILDRPIQGERGFAERARPVFGLGGHGAVLARRRPENRRTSDAFPPQGHCVLEPPACVRAKRRADTNHPRRYGPPLHIGCMAQPTVIRYH